MLKPIKRGRVRAIEGRFVIVASRYNARYVDAMLRSARSELRRAGANRVEIVRVPGAFEIPVVAARLAASSQTSRIADHALGITHHGSRVTDPASPSAIICFGVILRGETTHAAHIGEAVSRALMEIQLRYEVPVIHEVLLLENEAQARARCLSRTHNRGAEAAQTALAMAEVMRKIQSV